LRTTLGVAATDFKIECDATCDAPSPRDAMLLRFPAKDAIARRVADDAYPASAATLLDELESRGHELGLSSDAAARMVDIVAHPVCCLLLIGGAGNNGFRAA